MDAEDKNPDSLEASPAAKAHGGGLGASLALLGAAVLALIAANSSTAPLYEAVRSARLGFALGDLSLPQALADWIDDGPMAVFFLLVSLEIKRELGSGGLTARGQAALPAACALGGMIAPALIYLALDGGAQTWRGWAIPSATDIAFSLAILGLFGRGLPSSLRLFLSALAILDDLGAIIIIAVFYGARLSSPAIAFATLGVAALALLNRTECRATWPFLVAGGFLWACLLPSGLHPTLAGVAVGLAIPAGDGGPASPLRRLERTLTPWVGYLVLPLFAFVNAGVGFGALGPALLQAPLPGIALGLFLGKPLGVLAAAWAILRLGQAELPQGADWRLLAGVAMLTGVGFTMSLFIGDIAFADPALQGLVRLGVLCGSTVSALAGAATLVACRLRRA